MVYEPAKPEFRRAWGEAWATRSLESAFASQAIECHPSPRLCISIGDGPALVAGAAVQAGDHGPMSSLALHKVRC